MKKKLQEIDVNYFTKYFV